jgi:hypothetical protein
LEVTRGAFGSPLAKLAEIEVDTSFIAKERARDHLLGQIKKTRDEILELEEPLRRQRSILEGPPVEENVEAIQNLQTTVNCFPALLAAAGALVVAIVIFFILAQDENGANPCGTSIWLSILLPIIAFSIVVNRGRIDKDKAIRDGYAARTSQLADAEADAEANADALREKRQELVRLMEAHQRLERELDELARRV